MSRARLGMLLFAGLLTARPVAAQGTGPTRDFARSQFAGGWVVYFVAAATGAGGMFPMAANRARGAPALDPFVGVALTTVALALFALCVIVLRAARAGRPA